MTDRAPVRRPIRDRHVVYAAAAVVAFVLLLRLLSDYVPGVADLLGYAPVLILGLVLVTAIILIRALRSS